MLTLHHLEYSQSFRILWLLEELDIDYELKIYQRDKKTLLAPAEYKAISPLGTSPVISDGDLALAETSAIADYLLDQYPDADMRPDVNAPNRAEYLFWFHASQGSMMPVLLMSTLFRIMQSRVPFFLKGLVRILLIQLEKGFVNPRLDALLTEAEQGLAEQAFFAGESLTLADILLSYPMEGLESSGKLAKFPHCQRWLEQIQARPAYMIAREKDGKTSSILPL